MITTYFLPQQVYTTKVQLRLKFSSECPLVGEHKNSIPWCVYLTCPVSCTIKVSKMSRLRAISSLASAIWRVLLHSRRTPDILPNRCPTRSWRAASTAVDRAETVITPLHSKQDVTRQCQQPVCYNGRCVPTTA